LLPRILRCRGQPTLLRCQGDRPLGSLLGDEAAGDVGSQLRDLALVIVVAHRLSTVRDADLVVAMADGAAVEWGTHAALLEQDGLYARLVRTQALAQ
jgi:ABC-type multidrug transport system fused ATPase/permease subunit